MLLDSQPMGCEFKPSTDRKTFLSLNRKTFLSFNIFPHQATSCDGDLEFSGVQIHWPLLVNQLRVQVGLRVPTPIS